MIILIVLIISYYLINDYFDKKEKAKVEITMNYNLEKCTSFAPLLIKISNKSSKNILRTEGRVEVYRKGYSNDLSNYNSEFETDRIIESGQEFSLCRNYVLDKSYYSTWENEFEFRLGYTYIRFK